MSGQPNTCPTPCQDHPLCLVREAEDLARLRAELAATTREAIRAARRRDQHSETLGRVRDLAEEALLARKNYGTKHFVIDVWIPRLLAILDGEPDTTGGA